MSKTIILSFDIEEWFHTSFMGEYIPKEMLNVSRIDINLEYPLILLEKYQIPATFFVLGSLAKQKKHIVERILKAGPSHEIASHSYEHELVFEMKQNEIRRNLADSKKLLEDLSGTKILGYRAPYFSIDDRAIETLCELGYEYDSSLHDFRLNPQYGHLNLPMKSTAVPGIFTYKTITEVTIPVKRYFKFLKFPFGGGGYFRLYPLKLQLHWLRSFLKTSDYFLMYMHPWEFDPDQPYLKDVPYLSRKRHYLGIKNQFEKVDAMLQQLKAEGYQFDTLANYLKSRKFFR
jgi:polysaccharide deacetylase family protein (PEP-CTERM system associated)